MQNVTVSTIDPRSFLCRTHRKPAAYVSDRLLVPAAQAGPTPPSHTFFPGAWEWTTWRERPTPTSGRLL